ncbi:cutinase [Colletotrichum graminicola]|uniref:Cutinase n=1 Tax=Colletotrichum graminicola (strain M1.001 / M2 / FGSC 10212) TaxID=645133 RepID=E3Q3Z6_COLGM|nr:cutinase [Colletotrichum graminicola M1.001]EFQ25748.1 cutinase [Colletotrichum graminicola M1.001]WDK10896.1 cutinase [Colletotrichum graminicola]
MIPSPVAALGFLGALQGSANIVERQTKACATGVHIIVCRASTEKPGTGVIGDIATSIQGQIPGSDIEAVDYPAELNPYNPSEEAGVKAMTKLVQDYAARCPDTKMVLMGYSQGAQVTGDVMCGTSENGFTTTQPQSAEVAAKVAAILLMGDPSHVTGQPYNQGSSHNNGRFPRTRTAGCNAVADKMVSFCNTGDPFCDGGRNLQVHLSYVQTNGDAANQFIMSKVKAASS